MKILNNNTKYLSTDLIEECFELGKIHYVDKVVTGNGFTSGFGKLKPSYGKFNILIAPNQSIVKDKQREHELEGDKGFAKGLRCAFVYEGSSLMSFGDINRLELIVIVSDSFNNLKSEFKDRVDKIMIDEFHSVILQSSFRPKLKHLIHTLEDSGEFNNSAITFITASPIIKPSKPITIYIKNSLMSNRKLHVTEDRQASIKRCIASIESGAKTMIFTQDAELLRTILKDANRDDFKLISGDSFLIGIMLKGKYTLSDKSNIVVCTSAGFEGHSDYSLNGNNFIYMNTNSTHNTFLGCNIYQALGRLREGYNYSEICIVNIGGGGFPFKAIDNLSEVVSKFINDSSISIEKKQRKGHEFYYNRKKYTQGQISDYLYLVKDNEKTKYIEFEHGVSVHNEIRKINATLSYYIDYFKDRKITMIHIDDNVTRKGNRYIPPSDIVVDNIVYNITTNPKELRDKFKDFFFRSYLSADDPSSKEPNISKKAAKIANQCTMMIEASGRLQIPLEPKYYKLHDYMYNNGHKDELREIYMNNRKSRHALVDVEGEMVRANETRKKFDEETFDYTLDVALGMCTGYFKPNYVAWRDYNRLVLIGTYLLEYIANQLNLEVIEVDIKNCFPRILYAVNGLPLPNDFYGNKTDKDYSKRKIEMNKALNTVMFNPKKSTPEAKQKANQIRKLNKLGYDPIVSNYIVDKFFLSEFNGDLFNFLAYHESVIMRNAIKKIEDYNPQTINGEKVPPELFRRHDSFVTFKQLSTKPLDKFEYEGQIGWFNDFEHNVDNKTRQYDLPF